MNIRPISPKIGAIIDGIDLKVDLDESLAQEIKQLLIDYQVIFLKKQSVLTAEEYIQLVRKIHQPMCHPFISTEKPLVPGISPFQPYPEYPEITGIYHGRDNKGNLNEWHSDLNWLEKPSYGSVLRAIEVPAVGGDTIFCSMTAAYEDLSPELKIQCEHLKAYHDFTPIYQAMFIEKPDELRKMQAYYPPQAHPVILTHPLSGKKSIFVNRVSTTKILQIAEQESGILLQVLFNTANKPEYHARYHWEVNDIALWDNLATQHYAVSDYWPSTRKMERLSLSGIMI